MNSLGEKKSPLGKSWIPLLPGESGKDWLTGSGIGQISAIQSPHHAPVRMKMDGQVVHFQERLLAVRRHFSDHLYFISIRNPNLKWLLLETPPDPRVQDIPQPVSHQVDPQSGEKDGAGA
jgi:hypothetical protein